MKRIGIVFVLSMLLLGMVLVFGNEKTSGIVSSYDPTENSQYTGFPKWDDPENAYASDDSYATSMNVGNNISLYSGYGIEDMGTEITKVEIGVELYVDAVTSIMLRVSCDGNVSWGSANVPTNKLADDDTVEWFDVTDDSNCSPWTWELLSDTNLVIWIEGTGNPKIYLDYYPVRVTHSGAFHIQMLNPKDGDTVHNTIDFVSKVTTDTDVDEVTYYFNSLYHVATYDSDSNTFIYPEFNTRTLNNAYFTVVARANLTSGQYATRTIQIRVQNTQDKGCYFDDINNIWICNQNRYFSPPDGMGFGIYEMTKGTPQTYWEAFYYYEDSSSDATSHALYAPLDSTTYTDNEVVYDWIFLDDYNPTARCWFNDTKSTASTADDTILLNDTYQFFESLSGQNITINCSASSDAERFSRIFIADDFDWGLNTATNEYSYSFSFTSNLAGTMKEFAIGIPFDIAADVESVEVWDVSGNTQLVAQRDYRVTASSVEVGVQTLSSSGTVSLTITFSPYVTGTDILKPTMTILENDIETDPVIRNSHTYNRAYKTVYNSNNFDYSGVMIVRFQTATKVDYNSLIIEDSDGSTYEWYIEQGQVIVKDVSLDRHTNQGFYFYFDAISDEPVENLLGALLWIIVIVLVLTFILSLAYLVSAKPDADKKRVDTVRFACLLSGTLLAMVVGVVWIIPIFM